MDFLRIKNSQYSHLNKEAGQILLMVVLAAVVSLTVGLSAVSRTITNTRVTTEEANSQKALSAAEAGVDFLVGGSRPSSSETLSNESKYSARAVGTSSNQIILNGGNAALKDDGVDLWLSTHPDFSSPQWSGTMTVLWNGAPAGGNCSNVPAIELVVVYGTDKNNPSMTREVSDPCTTRANGFPPPDTLNAAQRTVNGTVFQNGITYTIDTAAPGFVARIIPLYANTVVGVRGTNAFPSQGTIINSVGTAGDTTRQIRAFKGWDRVPIEYFPYSVFLP